VLEGIKTCPVSVSQVNVIKKTAVKRIIKLNNISPLLTRNDLSGLINRVLSK
jgi:hypothetical protein